MIQRRRQDGVKKGSLKMKIKYLKRKKNLVSILHNFLAPHILYKNKCEKTIAINHYRINTIISTFQMQALHFYLILLSSY